ncbi:hypothetical protein ACROYT_G009156 [Oculina patagonica]
MHQVQVCGHRLERKGNVRIIKKVFGPQSQSSSVVTDKTGSVENARLIEVGILVVDYVDNFCYSDNLWRLSPGSRLLLRKKTVAARQIVMGVKYDYEWLRGAVYDYIYIYIYILLRRVFTNEDPTTIPAVGTEPKPAIGPLIVTIPGVIKQLQSLKPNKASGPDEIPPWFLKDYAVEIGPILIAIYQTSIDAGHVPSK